jgi:hypothetical protein
MKMPYFPVNAKCNPTGIQPLANYLSTGIKLFQNFPNPFAATTQITYSLSVQTYVKLAVYSCLGEEIKVWSLPFKQRVNTLFF